MDAALNKKLSFKNADFGAKAVSTSWQAFARASDRKATGKPVFVGDWLRQVRREHANRLQGLVAQFRGLKVPKHQAQRLAEIVVTGEKIDLKLISRSRGYVIETIPMGGGRRGVTDIIGPVMGYDRASKKCRDITNLVPGAEVLS